MAISNPASQLVITQQSSTTATAGSNFSTQPRLEARDSTGSVDGLFAGTWTMQTYSDSTCSTSVSGTVSGTYSSSNGVLTYSGVKFTTAGPLYIKFNSSGLTSACANLVTINAGSINKITFTTQPSGAGLSNTVLQQQPVVTGQDAYGNKVTSYTSSITLAAFSNSGCTTSVSGFSATANHVAAVAGDATYAGVKFSSAGTFYIKATQGARTTCSTAVVISAPAATFPPPFFRGY